MLNKPILIKSFDPSTWRKGENIVRKNLVLEWDQYKNELTGTVESESIYRLQYEVHIWYEEEFGDYSSVCECPVEFQCKHGAALAQTYLAKLQLNTGSPEHLVRSWIQSFSKDIKPQKPGKMLLYYLNSFGAQPGTAEFESKSLSCVVTKRNKNGSFSRTRANEYLSSTTLTQEYVTDEDAAILRSVLKGQNYSNVIEQFSTLERLIETERFFWNRESLDKAPISLAPTIDASWRWRKTTGDLFKISLELDARPNKDIALVKCQPLAYYDITNNSIGKISTGQLPETDRLLTSSPLINKDNLPIVLNRLQQSSSEIFSQIPPPKAVKLMPIATPRVHIGIFDRETINKTGLIKLNFFYDEVKLNPNKKDELVTLRDGSRALRNAKFEQQAIGRLTDLKFTEVRPYSYQYQGEKAPYYMGLDGKWRWFEFLHKQVPQLESLGWQIAISEDFPIKWQENDGQFDVDIDEDSGSDFFSIGLNLNIGGKPMPAFPILAGALQQLPKDILTAGKQEDPDASCYVELDDGHFTALKVSQFLPFVKQFIELLLPENINKSGRLTLPDMQAHQTLSFLDDQGIMAQGAKRIRQLADNLKSFKQIEEVTPPEGLNATLRGYQQQGLNWLQFLREFSLNGILADDMGLGKTIQTLSHLMLEKEQGRLTKPCLILAPTSVIHNWQNEINKFTPALTSIVITGNKRQQSLSQFKQYDVVITSYPLLNKDKETYQLCRFYYLILDEAHYIKNPKTLTYQSVLSIKADNKLCITGTPMENNLNEFWAQFNFLAPGFLLGNKQFTKLFRTPIEKHRDAERKQMLNNRIKPFILRRTKEKIAKDLPAKTEIIQTLKLEGKQAELYESVRLAMDSRISQLIEEKGIKRSQIEILDALLKLRQVCNHPQLLSLNSAKKVNQSAKMDYLMDVVPELISEGRRILIFSQFTSMLALIEAQLNKGKIDYLKLTGSTRNRQELVDKFQSEEIPVFLISLKAGGVGLNLTAADTVIHFDPWWNPAVENQATDRTHRIGQEKPVFVYKLIVENSIEQVIQTIQKNKASLAKALLSEETNESTLSLTEDIVKAMMTPLQ